MNLKQLPDLTCVHVKGVFDCSNNALETLIGSPSVVEKFFDCSCNNLKTLKGAPAKVGLDFNCRHNLLEDMNGCPQEIGQGLLCSHNVLKSLKGIAYSIGADIYLHGNPLLVIDAFPFSFGNNSAHVGEAGCGVFYDNASKDTFLSFFSEHDDSLKDIYSDLPKRDGLHFLKASMLKPALDAYYQKTEVPRIRAIALSTPFKFKLKGPRP